MPDEQDEAEALDEDKVEDLPETRSGIDVVDQTADATPGEADIGREIIDGDETGSDLDGVLSEPDRFDDPFHSEVAPAEVAAMHVVDDPDADIASI